MRGREGLVLYAHDEEGPANAVKSHACFVGSRIAMSWGWWRGRGSRWVGRRAVSGVLLLPWWRQQSHTKAQEYANSYVRAHSQSRHMSQISSAALSLSSGVEVVSSRHFCFIL